MRLVLLPAQQLTIPRDMYTRPVALVDEHNLLICYFRSSAEFHRSEHLLRSPVTQKLDDACTRQLVLAQLPAADKT